MTDYRTNSLNRIEIINNIVIKVIYIDDRIEDYEYKSKVKLGNNLTYQFSHTYININSVGQFKYIVYPKCIEIIIENKNDEIEDSVITYTDYEESKIDMQNLVNCLSGYH